METIAQLILLGSALAGGFLAVKERVTTGTARCDDYDF
jgi:hypothetical protein